MIKWLDLLEESQDMVSIQLADYQQKLTWGYNRNVMPREFVAGDLVLQRAVGKLAPNWEGPYQVTAVAGIDLLSRGYGGKTTSPTLEREQYEEVLSLVVIIKMDVSCCK